ncbi:hypothetical protein N0V83_010774 [Neocucurbitaria cava]|uniref:Uncharacterized protein n=1 Tax=Neocucurbitaria cava TaxID=798079 RepID=A0A9W8XXV7_9PLEO|nr:hypothetical protein N0V83_010774 [Neocucurbitaria cava]
MYRWQNHLPRDATILSAAPPDRLKQWKEMEIEEHEMAEQDCKDIGKEHQRTVYLISSRGLVKTQKYSTRIAAKDLVDI